jgi:hypothetical protein
MMKQKARESRKNSRPQSADVPAAIKRFPSASQGGIALRAVAWESLSISCDASLTLQYACLVPKDFPPQTDARFGEHTDFTQR